MEVFSFSAGTLKLLDQRKLPFKEEYLLCKNYKQTIGAIREMAVRGAPAISIAGAYALSQAEKAGYIIDSAAEEILNSRPTAIDLKNAIDFMKEGINNGEDSQKRAAEWEQSIYNKCKLICMHGAELIGEGNRVLTHCNTGPIAVGKYGTALGAILYAHKKGKGVFAWVDETRPRFQGALTSYELSEAGVPHNVITDSTAGSLMRKGEVDLIMVGADRICKNGDFANKIGTYPLAVLAKHHRIPFYVLAPSSTIDSKLESGEKIPIERRDEREILEPAGVRAFAEGTRAANFAFDVTPASLVTAYVTEHGLSCSPPE
ncbi:S-methyl-5-thioribose-1-phosphate isomerase [Candidatus Micrarchaeota archaeon]|nr:S-methyl-5-thioribose-1-phosphate isomerase [Candidatus Micrarchaeota archaeon]